MVGIAQTQDENAKLRSQIRKLEQDNAQLSSALDRLTGAMRNLDHPAELLLMRRGHDPKAAPITNISKALLPRIRVMVRGHCMPLSDLIEIIESDGKLARAQPALNSGVGLDTIQTDSERCVS